MITVAGSPPQKRQKGGVFRHRESIKGNYNEISLLNTFNVRWNGKVFILYQYQIYKKGAQDRRFSER